MWGTCKDVLSLLRQRASTSNLLRRHSPWRGNLSPSTRAGISRSLPAYNPRQACLRCPLPNRSLHPLPPPFDCSLHLFLLFAQASHAISVPSAREGGATSKCPSGGVVAAKITGRDWSRRERQHTCRAQIRHAALCSWRRNLLVVRARYLAEPLLISWPHALRAETLHPLILTTTSGIMTVIIAEKAAHVVVVRGRS